MAQIVVWSWPLLQILRPFGGRGVQKSWGRKMHFAPIFPENGRKRGAKLFCAHFPEMHFAPGRRALFTQGQIVAMAFCVNFGQLSYMGICCWQWYYKRIVLNICRNVMFDQIVCLCASRHQPFSPQFPAVLLPDLTSSQKYIFILAHQ